MHKKNPSIFARIVLFTAALLEIGPSYASDNQYGYGKFVTSVTYNKG